MLETTQSNVHVVTDTGPMCQVLLNQAQLQLAAPGTSPVMQSAGYTKLAVAATSSTAGQITVQRFIDEFGQIPQGPALTQALTAGASGVLNITDGVPFLSFTVAISGGTLTGVAALLQAL